MEGETHHAGTLVLLSRALWQIQVLRNDIVVLVPFQQTKKHDVERDEIIVRQMMVIRAGARSSKNEIVVKTPGAGGIRSDDEVKRKKIAVRGGNMVSEDKPPLHA